MPFLKGIVEGNLDKIKDLNIDENKLYLIKNLPQNSISNYLMSQALIDNSIAAFFKNDNTFVCIDDGTYLKGHIYM